MAPLTEERLAEMQARATAATPGPWTWTQLGEDYGTMHTGGPDGIVYSACRLGGSGSLHWEREPDAQFAAHAREDVPALVAEVRRLRVAVRFITGCACLAVGVDLRCHDCAFREDKF